jgi:hypothetical protein
MQDGPWIYPPLYALPYMKDGATYATVTYATVTCKPLTCTFVDFF